MERFSDIGQGPPHRAGANLLLDRLPWPLPERLEGTCRHVALRTGAVLFSAQERLDHVYFPGSGVVSLSSDLPGGEAVAVALVGRTGIVGLPLNPDVAMLPYTGTVMLPGTALRAPAD